MRRLKNRVSSFTFFFKLFIFYIAYCNNILPLGYNILPIACLFLLPIAYLCLLPVFGLCCTTPTSASAVASVFFWLPAPPFGMQFVYIHASLLTLFLYAFLSLPAL